MDDLTSQGIQALKAGDRDKARSLLLSALEKNEDNLQAWLWLSGAVTNDQDQLECLQQVLRIDPENQAAQKGIAVLSEKVTKAPPEVEIHDVPEPEVAEPAPISPFTVPLEEEKPTVPAAFEAPTAAETAVKDEPTPAAEEPVSVPTLPAEESTPVPPQPAEEPTPANEPAFPFFMGDDKFFADANTPADTQTEESTPEKPEIPAEPVAPASPSAETEAMPEDYKLPDSFFSNNESSSEPFPEWMNALGGTPAAAAPVETTEAKPEAGTEPEPEAQPAASIASDESLPPMQPETPQPPVIEPQATSSEEKGPEKVQLKFRPSLSTAIIVYGVGIIILFFLFILLTTLVIKNIDQMPSILLLGLIFLAILIVLVFFIVRIVDHLTTSYILTNRRIYIEKGVSNRKRKSIYLAKIKDLQVKHGILQRILGIGNLLVTSEGQEGDEVNTLVDVSSIKRVLRRIENELHPPEA